MQTQLTIVTNTGASYLPFLTHCTISDLFTKTKLNSPRVHAQIPQNSVQNMLEIHLTQTPSHRAFNRQLKLLVAAQMCDLMF